jgi:hypothetical protein
MKPNQKNQSWETKEKKWVTYFRSWIKPDLKLVAPILFKYVSQEMTTAVILLDFYYL